MSDKEDKPLSIWPGWRVFLITGLIVLAWTALLALLGLAPEKAVATAVAVMPGLVCPLVALGLSASWTKHLKILEEQEKEQ